MTDFIFLGSIITAYGDCSSEIKRHFLLGRQAMTNLDSVLKSRDIITDNAEIQRIIRKLSTEELMFSSCGAGEDSRESFGPQDDQTQS